MKLAFRLKGNTDLVWRVHLFIRFSGGPGPVFCLTGTGVALFQCSTLVEFCVDIHICLAKLACISKLLQCIGRVGVCLFCSFAVLGTVPGALQACCSIYVKRGQSRANQRQLQSVASSVGWDWRLRIEMGGGAWRGWLPCSGGTN